MSDSILTSTKKLLGITEEYTHFDTDIIMHINSCFSTLNQLGIGPADGFAIVDATAKWDAFLGNNLRLNPVQTYVVLRLRLIFDPPTTSYVLASFENQIAALEWRLNVERETFGWVDPDPDPYPCEDDVVSNISEPI